MKANSVKDILIATKGIFSRRGWCQKSIYLDAGGRFPREFPSDIVSCCLSGAIQLLSSEGSNQSHIIDTCTYLESLIGTSIPSWNDVEDRTKEDVIKLLDQAIGSLS